MPTTFTSFISTVDLRQTVPTNPDDATNGGQAAAPAVPSYVSSNQPPPINLTKFKIALSDSVLSFSLPLAALLMDESPAVIKQEEGDFVTCLGDDSRLSWLKGIGLVFGQGDVTSVGHFCIVKHSLFPDEHHALISITNGSVETLLRVLTQVLKNVNSSSFLTATSSVLSEKEEAKNRYQQSRQRMLVSVARAIYCDYCIAIAEMAPVVGSGGDSSAAAANNNTPENTAFLRDVMGVVSEIASSSSSHGKDVSGEPMWPSSFPSASAVGEAVIKKLQATLLRGVESQGGGEGEEELTGLEDMDFWSPCVMACHMSSSTLIHTIITGSTTQQQQPPAAIHHLGNAYLTEFLQFHADHAKEILVYMADASSMVTLTKETMKCVLHIETLLSETTNDEQKGAASAVIPMLRSFVDQILQPNSGITSRPLLPQRVIGLAGGTSQAIFVDMALNAEDTAVEASVQPDDVIGRQKDLEASLSLLSASSVGCASPQLKQVLLSLLTTADDLKEAVQEALLDDETTTTNINEDQDSSSSLTLIKRDLSKVYKRCSVILNGVPFEGALPEDVFILSSSSSTTEEEKEAVRAYLSGAEFTMVLPLDIPRLTTEIIPFLKGIQQEHAILHPPQQQHHHQLSPTTSSSAPPTIAFGRIATAYNKLLAAKKPSSSPSRRRSSTASASAVIIPASTNGFGNPFIIASKSSSANDETSSYNVGLMVDVDALCTQVCDEGDLSKLAVLVKSIPIVPMYWSTYPSSDTGLCAISHAVTLVANEEGKNDADVVVGAIASLIMRSTLMGATVSPSNIHLRNQVKCWALVLEAVFSCNNNKGGEKSVSAFLPHLLTHDIIRSQGPIYLSFIIHHLALQCHVQQGSKTHFFEKCCIPSLTFTSASSASSATEILDFAMASPQEIVRRFLIASSGGLCGETKEGEEGEGAATVNPFTDSNRRCVRLHHLQLLRRVCLPMTTLAELRTTADSIRAGVQASRVAVLDEGVGGTSPPRSRRPSSFEAIPSSFTHLSKQVTMKPSSDIFPFRTAARHIPFDSEDCDVKEVRGLAVPRRSSSAAAATTTTTTHCDNNADADNITAAGQLPPTRLLIGGAEASRRVVSSLDGAWSTVGAVFGACACTGMVESTFEPFRSSPLEDDQQQSEISLQQQQQYEQVVSSVAVGAKHNLWGVAGQFERRRSQVPSTQTSPDHHHVAERFMRKLEYLLDHPSMINYSLSGPDSHAAGFAELWTTRSAHIKEDKRYKTRVEMLYDAAMSPLIEFTVVRKYTELRREADVAKAASSGNGGEDIDESALFIKAVQQSKKVPDCMWVRLWYMWFRALRNNGLKRLESLAILNVGGAHDAAEVVVDDEEDESSGAKKTAAVVESTPTTTTTTDGDRQDWNPLTSNETEALTVGLQEVVKALGFIVEELEAICPQLTGKSDSEVRESEESAPSEVSLEALFETAQKGFGKVADKHPNDVKLRFYGLFKQATVGDVNTKRPWGFDMAGKAKWDAWSKEKGVDKEEAMRMYVEEWGKLH